MMLDTTSTSGLVMVSVAGMCSDGTRFFNPEDAKKFVERLELVTDLGGSGRVWLEGIDSKFNPYAVKLEGGQLWGDQGVTATPRASGSWGKFKRGIAARAKWS